MRNFYITTFLIISIVLSIRGQGIRYGSRVTLKGQIIDANTKKPIAFANIGFIGKGIGTVSNEDGTYAFTFAPATLEPTDRLQFSVVGYKSQIFSKNESLLSTEKPLIVSLKRETYSLSELVLGETKRILSTTGDLDYDDRIIGYWKDIEGLGGEILTKIKIRRKNTKLHNLKFKVLENGADSLLIRVNVYDDDRNSVGNNLLNKSILYTINQKTGLVSIPLKRHNIIVNENIIVGIELLKVYGSQIGFSLAGSRSKGISFVRYRSQDSYKPVKNTSMAFELDTSTPIKNKNSTKERETPNSITLYWDTSASTDHRDVKKELEIIESLLDETREAEVEVIKFSMKNVKRKTFCMQKAKSYDILSYLKDTAYNGLSQIEDLPRPEDKENAAILLVTSGQTFLSEITPDFPNPVFVITTNPQADIESLEPLAIYSDGDLLDGSKESIKELQKRYTQFIDEPTIPKFPEQQATGKITYNQRDSVVPLQGASVAVRGSYTHVKTDSNGLFSIPATSDDILEVSFPGMDTQEKKASLKKKNNLVLKSNSEVLDQVVIVGNKSEGNLKETPAGKRDERAVAYKNNIIGQDDIKVGYISLGDILRRESNIQVLYDPFTRQEIFIFPRTYYASILNPQPPIIVIDGQIYQQNSLTTIPQIDPQNIESVTTSSSITVGNRYGSVAAGGVISIKTKNQNFKIKIEKPTALVQGNNYNEIDVSLLTSLAHSDVQRRLGQGKNLSESKEIYFEILKTRTNASLSFYMQAFNFFKDKDSKFALKAISSMIAKAPKNIKVLRTVGYALQEIKENTLAQRLYEEILKRSPEEIQSYRDLAAAYTEANEYKKAFEIYKTILADDVDTLEFESLRETAEIELQQLVKNHKSKLSYEDLPTALLDVSFKKDRRLVFEWNDPSLQFELQFVSPEGKYFTWNHTIYKNKERLLSNMKNGMMMKEFELDNQSQGKWIINLSVLRPSKTPQVAPYMRYTLYTNYATPQENKDTKIIALKNLDKKVTIDHINVNTSAYEN